MTNPLPFPPPDLLAAKRVLAVQPHYDDNDIAAGGTLAALAAQGVEIVYLTVTDDRVGVLDQTLSDEAMAAQLRAEQQGAGAIIGVKAHYWLDYPDAGRFDHHDLRQAIIRHIRLVRPDFLLTCDPWLPYEAHYDHVRTGRAAAEAALVFAMSRLKTDPAVDAAFSPYDLTGVAFYGTAYPNTFVDISATRGQKHRAIDCYRAQFDEGGLAVLHQMLDVQERAYAQDKPYSHAETLKALHPWQLHLFGEAWRS